MNALHSSPPSWASRWPSIRRMGSRIALTRHQVRQSLLNMSEAELSDEMSPERFDTIPNIVDNFIVRTRTKRLKNQHSLTRLNRVGSKLIMKGDSSCESKLNTKSQDYATSDRQDLSDVENGAFKQYNFEAAGNKNTAIITPYSNTQSRTPPNVLRVLHDLEQSLPTVRLKPVHKRFTSLMTSKSFYTSWLDLDWIPIDMVMFEQYTDTVQILASMLLASPRPFDWITSIIFSAGMYISPLIGTFSRDLAFVLFPIQTYIVLVLALIFFGQLFKFQPDTRHLFGKEAFRRHEDIRANLLYTRRICFVLFLVYSPLAVSAANAVSCKQEPFLLQVWYECRNSLVYKCMCIVVVCLLLLYTLPLPIAIAQHINVFSSNKDGFDRKNQTNDSNFELLEFDLNSFTWLHGHLKPSWIQLRPIILLFKLLLVLPIAVMDASYNSLNMLSVLVLLHTVGYIIIAQKSNEYCKSTHSQLACLFRIVVLVLSLLAVCSATINSIYLLDVFAYMVATVVIIFPLGAFVAFIASSPPAIVIRRSIQHLLDLAQTADGQEWLVLSSAFNVSDNRRKRIWYEFWDTLLLQDEECVSTSYKNSPNDEKFEYRMGPIPPTLLNFHGTAAERHDENQTIALSESLKVYTEYIALHVEMIRNPEQAELREAIAFLVQHVNGVDAYYDGVVENESAQVELDTLHRVTKHNSSSTNFGRLQIIAFPFCAVFYPDDIDDIAIISPVSSVAQVRRSSMSSIKTVIATATKNQTVEILRKRKLRRILRALEGRHLDFTIKKALKKQKEKKHRMMEAQRRRNAIAVGNIHSVNVMCKFSLGRFEIRRRWDIEAARAASRLADDDKRQTINMARGFDCRLVYRDGHGVDRLSDKAHHHQKLVLYGKEFGITPALSTEKNDKDGSNLSKLLDENWFSWNGKEAQEEYRAQKNMFATIQQDFIEDMKKRSNALSYAFHVFIYENDRIDRNLMETALKTCELHKAIKTLPERYIDDFDNLFNKLAYYDTHPMVALWFSFWHDVWLHNSAWLSKGFNSSMFDITSELAIAYHPMSRELLEKELKKSPHESKLTRTNILDKLYERMEHFATKIDVFSVTTTSRCEALDQLTQPDKLLANYTAAVQPIVSTTSDSHQFTNTMENTSSMQ